MLDQRHGIIGRAVTNYHLKAMGKCQSPRMEYIPTRGCPAVETVGPCSEWQETMCTSAGRYFSKAAFSGAFTDVWPATIAPTFVAVDNEPQGQCGYSKLRTWTILRDNAIDVLCFNRVDDVVGDARDKMAVLQHMDAWNACRLRCERPEVPWIKAYIPSYLSFRASYFVGRSHMYILKSEMRS